MEKEHLYEVVCVGHEDLTMVLGQFLSCGRFDLGWWDIIVKRVRIFGEAGGYWKFTVNIT